jgi:hypothetical protein
VWPAKEVRNDTIASGTGWVALEISPVFEGVSQNVLGSADDDRAPLTYDTIWLTLEGYVETDYSTSLTIHRTSTTEIES